MELKSLPCTYTFTYEKEQTQHESSLKNDSRQAEVQHDEGRQAWGKTTAVEFPEDRR